MLRGRLACSITHFGLDGLVIRTVSGAMVAAWLLCDGFESR